MRQVKCDNPNCPNKITVAENDIGKLKAICCCLSCVEAWENLNGLIVSPKTQLLDIDYKQKRVKDITITRLNQK